MKRYGKDWLYSEEYIVHLNIVNECVSYVIGCLTSEEDANIYKNHIEKLINKLGRNDILVITEPIKVFPLR